MKIYTLIFLLSIALHAEGAKKVVETKITRVVCYYSSGAYKRPSEGKFTVEDIDGSKCTHLIYAFIGINKDGSIKILDQLNDITNNGFKNFNALKVKNTNLKTMISVGGSNEGVEGFVGVTSDLKTIRKFAENAIIFMNTYGFDGIDIAWQYPGKRGGKSSDKNHFIRFMRELQKALSGRKVAKKFILSAAVAPDTKSIKTSYAAKPLFRTVDFINLMSYDFHTASDNVTGLNAPLDFSRYVDKSKESKELNVRASVTAWIKATRDPQKINLGIPLYGRSFTLKDPARKEIGDAVIKPGKKGSYTEEDGFLGYNEICEMEEMDKKKKDKWNPVFDDEGQVPYNIKGDQWISYEGPKSVEAKIKFARELKLGGLMVWSIDTDDFKGTCGPKNVLLTLINRALTNGP